MTQAPRKWRFNFIVCCPGPRNWKNMDAHRPLLCAVLDSLGPEEPLWFSGCQLRREPDGPTDLVRNGQCTPASAGGAAKSNTSMDSFQRTLGKERHGIQTDNLPPLCIRNDSTKSS